MVLNSLDKQILETFKTLEMPKATATEIIALRYFNTVEYYTQQY